MEYYQLKAKVEMVDRMFKMGEQSKQAEIDELKMTNHNLSVMVAEAESYSEYWKYERDKLQKRIDTVLDYIEPIDEISHKAYRELYKILKGDQLWNLRML